MLRSRLKDKPETKVDQNPMEDDALADDRKPSADRITTDQASAFDRHPREAAANGANRFPTVLPRDGQTVIAMIKGGPLAILQYRETAEQRRRNGDPGTAPHAIFAGDFYGSHAGSSEYSTIVGGVEAWAALPDMRMAPAPNALKDAYATDRLTARA